MFFLDCIGLLTRLPYRSTPKSVDTDKSVS